MPAARRLRGDRPLKNPDQAIALLQAERDRVKMTPTAHHMFAQRIRPEAHALSSWHAKRGANVSTFRTFLPWAQALGLQMVIIDGDIEHALDTPADLVQFAYTALRRRELPMEHYIRAYRETGEPGSRAFKELRMGTAKDVWLGSLLTHARQLGVAIVLRTA